MIEVNDKSFEREVIEASKKGTAVIVAAVAGWCKDSQRLLKIIPKIEKKYEGKIKFVKVETEKEPGKRTCPVVHDALHIREYPTLSIFKKGRLVIQRISAGKEMYQLMDLHEFADIALSR